MTWCNSFNDVRAVENNLATAAAVAAAKKQQQASSHVNLIRTCPSCGHRAQYEQVRVHACACPTRSCACEYATTLIVTVRR